MEYNPVTFHLIENLQVDVVFHESHPGITRPALLVVVAHDVFVVRIRMFRQVALDQVSCLFCTKPIIMKQKIRSLHNVIQCKTIIN